MSGPFPFEPLTVATATDAARPMLAASERRFGFVPSPVARVAHAPGTLKHLLGALAAFEQTSLGPIEREVVAMTVAWENECRYCMAMHSALLAGAPDQAPVVAALREGTPIPDTRLEALRRFTRAVVRERGRTSDETWAAFREAGFTEEQAIEVVLGVGVYVLSTLLNIVTRAELDPPFASFDWQRPVPRAA